MLAQDEQMAAVLQGLDHLGGLWAAPYGGHGQEVLQAISPFQILPKGPLAMLERHLERKAPSP